MSTTHVQHHFLYEVIFAQRAASDKDYDQELYFRTGLEVLGVEYSSSDETGCSFAIPAEHANAFVNLVFTTNTNFGESSEGYIAEVDLVCVNCNASTLEFNFGVDIMSTAGPLPFSGLLFNPLKEQ